jgi:hypothetical protein
MTDDQCRAIRAEAEALRREVALLRGVVAALRTPGPRRKPRVSRRATFAAGLVGFAGGMALCAALSRMILRR